MADSVDRVFVHALNTVKKIPKTGAARPPAADRMRLYGLYKQAMEGDVDGVMDRPNAYSGLSVDEIRREQDKWDSWNAQRGLGRTEAKRRYIETLIDTMHTYANTQPAVELVAELEFVWNQIKDNDNNNNSPSSSGSFRKERDAYGISGGGVGVTSPRPDEYYDAYDGRPQRDRKAERESQRDREREQEREADAQRMSATASDGGPMKVLSPMSEEDEVERENRMRMIEEELAAEVEEEEEEEDREEEEDYARRTAPFGARGLRRGPARGGGRGSVKGPGRGFGRDAGRAATQPDDKDNDEPATQPSQRWSKMMERAMVKLSAEIAALREQIMSGREFRSQQETARRKTWFNRFGLLAWALFKHVAVDVVLLAAILLWMRRRKDRRLEDHVREALTVLREYIRKVLPAR